MVSVVVAGRRIDWCTWYTGLNTECGDDASALRDGLPLCPAHVRAHDALALLDRIHDREVAAGRLCGDHDRPTPCIECTAD